MAIRRRYRFWTYLLAIVLFSMISLIFHKQINNGFSHFEIFNSSKKDPKLAEKVKFFEQQNQYLRQQLKSSRQKLRNLVNAKSLLILILKIIDLAPLFKITLAILMKMLPKF
ncbi:hypothetical protein SSS_10496 [Sarcoptes scabiei]|nr:hypothetical protein SSS_10496 [Sarcoptes scabiei]